GHIEVNTTYYLSWGIMLLPYIEQDTLYRQYNNNISNESAGNQGFVTSPCPLFYCPADTRAGHTFLPETLSPNGGSNSNTFYMASSYKAMSGIGDTATTDTFAGYFNEVQV